MHATALWCCAHSPRRPTRINCSTAAIDLARRSRPRRRRAADLRHPRAEPGRYQRVPARGRGIQGVPHPPPLTVPRLRDARRLARPRRRAARHDDIDCFLSQFIFKTPGRVGPALSPGLLLLPVHAGAARGRRVDRGNRRRARQRSALRRARQSPRARAHTRRRRPPEREPRVLRDRRPRSVGGGRRSRWSRATCCCSTAISCTSRPTTVPTRRRAAMVYHYAPPARSITRSNAGRTRSTTGCPFAALASVAPCGPFSKLVAFRGGAMDVRWS